MSGAGAGLGLAGCGRMWAWRVHAYGGAELRAERRAGPAGEPHTEPHTEPRAELCAELRAEPARLPSLRAPDHLLVRVRASSLNPLDLAMIGGYGRRVLNAARALEAAVAGGDEGGGVEFPLVVGRDFAGEVVRAGAEARGRLPPGTRVWGVVPPHWPGAHAQYVLVRERWAGPAPEQLSDLQAGGALYAALTACSLLRAAGLGERGEARGARVLLLGLGGVGRAALRLLRVRGAAVVVGCSADAAPAALALGAVAALDRHREDYDSQLVESGPYDAILDCAGLGGQEASARQWRFGRYVTLTTPLLRETDARGAVAGAAAALGQLARHCALTVSRAPPRPALLPPHVRWAFFTPSQRDIQMLHRLAERGQFSVEVEERWGWRGAVAAFSRLAGGGARGKLLLDFTDHTAPAHHTEHPPKATDAHH